MTVLDFNSLINFGQITFVQTLKGLTNAHRENSFLTTDADALGSSPAPPPAIPMKLPPKRSPFTSGDLASRPNRTQYQVYSTRSFTGVV